jgi:calcineurin-like phosphoesterase family protein
MPDIWLISDLHLGHEKTCTEFKRKDGSPLRDFNNASEMNDLIISNWQKTVKTSDKVYVLGDVTMQDKFLKILGFLNGHKRLVAGNHDHLTTKMYMQYFEAIYGCRVLDRIALTHVPIHPMNIEFRWNGNAHGHTHSYHVADGRYFNCCVEENNYTPIHFEVIRDRIHNSKEHKTKQIKDRNVE